jgi:hypothetical protein
MMDRKDFHRYLHAATQCPDEDQLSQVHAGTAPQEIVLHTQTCEKCRATLADFADFFDSPRDGETSTPPDAPGEYEKFNLRARMPVVMPSRHRSWSRASLAVAASLVLALAASAAFNLMLWRSLRTSEAAATSRLNVLRAELETFRAKNAAPDTAEQLIDLFAVGGLTRGGLSSRPVPAIDAGRSVTLILNGAPPNAAGSVELRQADRMIWSGGPLRTDRQGVGVLRIPSPLVTPGEYQITFSMSGFKANYAFRVPRP